MGEREEIPHIRNTVSEAENLADFFEGPHSRPGVTQPILVYTNYENLKTAVIIKQTVSAINNKRKTAKSIRSLCQSSLRGGSRIGDLIPRQIFPLIFLGKSETFFDRLTDEVDVK